MSHESQLLEDFSLCILQKHNCLGKSAEIPALPDPPPMASFRGEDLTHELAETLFIGWLGVCLPPPLHHALSLSNTFSNRDVWQVEPWQSWQKGKAACELSVHAWPHNTFAISAVWIH